MDYKYLLVFLSLLYRQKRETFKRSIVHFENFLYCITVLLYTRNLHAMFLVPHVSLHDVRYEVMVFVRMPSASRSFKQTRL